MIKKLALIACLLTTPALAETWSTGDCTLQSGGKIKYILNNGHGYITYDDKGPYEMFSKRQGDMGIITHIGSSGNTVIAVDLNTGRGYIITQFDNGQKNERNISCRLGVATK